MIPARSRCFGIGIPLMLVSSMLVAPSESIVNAQSGFLSRSWHITSRGMFAGSCIGVICLVMSLEMLRRVQREYDTYIKRRLQPNQTPSGVSQNDGHQQSDSEQGSSKDIEPGEKSVIRIRVGPAKTPPRLFASRRVLVQRQLVRATIHMLQFAVAYFVMLLAMYYNGEFLK